MLRYSGLLVRADSFLACTPQVTFSSRLRHGVVEADALQLDGTGTVALSSHGHAVVVDLAEGDSCVTPARFLSC